MRILRIAGRNLASLADDFSVDFEAAPLAASGLFAISGPTGAGKSTLLDALCLALYGATPRLKKGGALVPDIGSDAVAAQDPRSLLRRGAGEGYAEVDFVGNDGARYRAQWSVWRARKRPTGALQAAAMSLHRLPEMAAIGGKSRETAEEIEKRIGLTFDQFTRAVLLAQNEFAAFLKTDENDRGELLETLTGSAIYSVISKRAYERYKREQEASRQLTARLAEQAPCSVEERAALDADSIRADAALADLDARQQSLEQLQRWQQAGTALAESVTGAEAALATATAGVAGVLARRQQLSLLAALDEARPLHADLLRLRRQQATLAQDIAGAQAATEAAQVREQQAALACEEAAATLLGAEQALAAAGQPLDAAKALDAAIAALAPAHAQAQAAHQQSSNEAERTAAAAQAAGSALASLRQEHAATAQWLQQHAALAVLAAQWPRWDSLLAQAGRARASAAALDSATQAARRKAAASTASAVAADGAAQDAAGHIERADAARQQAASAFAAFDSSALRTARADLAAQREQLDQARGLWLRLGDHEQRGAALVVRVADARTRADAAQAAAAAADQAAAPLAAALQQAEHALRGAELACADKVEDLRGQLRADAPCPVCGAIEHPYADASPALQAVLARLREQLLACRTAANANLERLAGARAEQAAARSQATALAADLQLLDEDSRHLRAQWRDMPLAAMLEQEGAVPAAADASAPAAHLHDSVVRQCASRLQALETRMRAIDASEEQARVALLARDAAQAAFDDASRRHAAAIDSAASARLTASSTAGELAALADKAAAAGADLHALLADLDGAFASAPAVAADLFANEADNWRQRWQDDPAAFHADSARQASDYNTRSLAQAERQTRLAALAAQHAASIGSAQQAAAAAAEAQRAFAQHADGIGERQRQRALLFGGDAVDAVESRLHGAVSGARAALAARQLAAKAASVDAARSADQLQQLQARSMEGAAQLRHAEQTLGEWLAGFPGRHPDIAAIPSADTLESLLAIPSALRHAEQQAIDAIDGAAAAAATVLAERRAQLVRHGEQAPPGYRPDAMATNAADLLELAEQRRAAAETAAALRARVAEDTVRRSNAEQALAAIDRQQLAERRWGRMAELIGSADGKKFRNYAQQFTLDVLLGYANAHLAELAKRYRLERVGSANGPSLGLMVRDQDMGGEARGVNSLSGGESFLVSLALALGLASLSSNRVRVESLFIDEGFGSLDSETLRVAMDALDGLQAMGRKVGVISHVQEMTERIATRIVVAPAGAGSSTVSVE